MSIQRRNGIFLIVLSAVAFGWMPIFGSWAYNSGVNTQGLLLIRFSVAGLVMAAVMLIRRATWPRGCTLLGLMAMGGIAYVGQAFCYFSALRHGSAALAALFLCATPRLCSVGGFITLCLSGLGHAGLRVLVEGKTLGANVGCTGLSLREPHFDHRPCRWAMVGRGLWHHGGGHLFGLYHCWQPLNALGGRITSSNGGDAFRCGQFMDEYALEHADVAKHNRQLAAVAIALVSTVVAIFAFLAGLDYLSASEASTLSTLEPVVSVLLAALILGGHLSMLQWLGGAGILIAGLMIALAPVIPAPE